MDLFCKVDILEGNLPSVIIINDAEAYEYLTAFGRSCLHAHRMPFRSRDRVVLRVSCITDLNHSPADKIIVVKRVVILVEDVNDERRHVFNIFDFEIELFAFIEERVEVVVYNLCCILIL